MGVCRPVLQISDAKFHFSLPFLDQTSKIHTRIQTWHVGRNYVIITCHHFSSNPFRIRIFLFLSYLSCSYLFGIETIKTFIHSCSSLENYTRFQTKMDKFYTGFRPKRRKNPIRWGSTFLYSLYEGVTPRASKNTPRDLVDCLSMKRAISS